MPPSPPLPARVAAALASVRRRRRLLAVVQALAWACLGWAVLVVAAAVAGGGEPAGSAARWAARIWLGGTIVIPLLLFVVPTWRRTSDDAALAKAVDDRAHATAESLLTAVDLAAAMEQGTLSEDPETRRLAQRHLDSAADLARHVDARALVPWSLLAAARQAGPVGLVLLVAALVALPEDTRQGLDRLFSPAEVVEDVLEAKADEEPVTLVLRNVGVRLTPPEYSQRESLELAGTTGDFQALPGTAVVLEADVPVAGRSARLLWGDSVLAESDVQGRHLAFSFVTPAEGSGTYRVRMKKGIGSGELVTRAFRVDALPDKAPELEVLGPSSGVELRPGQTVPLELRASDDFALTRLERVVERNGRVVARFPMADVDGLGEATERFRWDPTVDLPKAGGELALVIEAYDNDTVNGPKLTRSRPLEVYIPTARDQHNKVLALQEKLLGAALDLLAEVLVDAEELREKRGDYVARVRLLDQHDRHAALAGELFAIAEQLSDQMRRDELSRPASFVGTGRVIENVARRWSALQEYVEREVRNFTGGGINPAIARRVGHLRDDAITELEQAVLDLADFIDLDRASGAVADLADLDADMSELADLLREGAEGGLVEDERIEAALQKLEEGMAELAEKLAQRRGGPDDGFQNRLPAEANESVREDVRKLIEEGKFEEALAKIQQAQDALAKMSDQLQSEMNTMAGSQDSSELSKAIEEAIEETRALEERQRALRDETEALAEQFGAGEGLSPNQQEKLLQEMDALLEDIASIPEGIESPTLKGATRRWAARAERAAEAMRSAFAEGAVEEAIALGLQAKRELESTRQGLELRGALEEAPAGLAEAEGRAGRAGGKTDALLEKLQGAQERAEQQRAQAGRGGEGTKRGQNGLAGDLAGLRRKVEGMGGSAFNPVSGRDNLRAAEDLMLRAGAKLEQGRPGRAMGAQDSAIQQLSQFRNSLEEAQQAMQQGQMPGSGMAGMQPGASQPWQRGRDMNGAQEDTGEVEMPEPEDFLGPEAFRELVLEGAQDDAPDRYRPLNGSYYEELVR